MSEKDPVISENEKGEIVIKNLPSNSFKNPKQQNTEPAKTEIIAKASKKKQSFGEKVSTSIIEESPKGVLGYIAEEVFLPAMKNLIFELISGGIERLLFGTSKAPSVNNSYRQNSRYVSYSSYAKPGRRSPSEATRRSRNARTSWRDLIFETKDDAENVLEGMITILDQYDVVTVSDLNEMSGVDSVYTDSYFGWDDLRNAGTKRVREGYILDLPLPYEIKN